MIGHPKCNKNVRFCRNKFTEQTILGTVPESSLSVDVETLALGSAVVNGQLTGDGQGVAQLGLSCPELAEQFRDRPRLDAPVQQLQRLLVP